MCLQTFSRVHLCFSLVVKREDEVSPPRLALPDQKHAVAVGSGALHQVGCLDPRDGAVKPGERNQEVIGLLDDLLREGEGDRAWRDKRN